MATGQLACQRPRSLLHLDGAPVFLYHGLIEDPIIEGPPRKRRYWVVASQFRDHLNQIRQSRYQLILLKELWTSMGAGSHGKPVAGLTFDDGLESDYQLAYPLLLEAGAKADFFVNTSDIGLRGHLGWQQITDDAAKWDVLPIPQP
ncbi:MAG TPA: polysaccharide deacetylase family protein [Candidatus Tectomicrobia bacterium]